MEILEEEQKENGTTVIFKEEMTENIPKLTNQATYSRNHTKHKEKKTKKKSIPTHIMVKPILKTMLNTKPKRNLKSN